MSDSLTPSSDSYRYNTSAFFWSAVREGIGGTTLSSSATTLKIGVNTTHVDIGLHQLYRASISFPLSDIIPSGMTEEEIAGITVISCTLTLRGISGSGSVVLVVDTGGWTQYGTANFVDDPFYGRWDLSVGENVGSFNANGINYIQSQLRVETDTIKFEVLGYSNDFRNSEPTSVGDRTFTVASVEHGTPAYRPTLTITWEVAGSEKTGSGGGVCGGTATIGAVSEGTTDGVSAAVGGIAGFANVDGSRDTSDTVAIIHNVATICDVTATHEAANHPARHLRFPEKPYLTYIKGSSGGSSTLTFYLDRLCDTVILFNFNAEVLYILLSATKQYSLTSSIQTDTDTGLKSCCFRYSERFSTFQITGSSSAFGYELGSVLAGTITDLTIKPQYPFGKAISEQAHDIDFDGARNEVQRIGRNKHLLEYVFPVMSRANFDELKTIERNLGARGLCGLYEKRGNYEASYICFRDGDFNYSDEEYQNMRAVMRFEEVS